MDHSLTIMHFQSHLRFLIIACLLVMTGCGSADETVSDAESAFHVTDFRGKQINFITHPDRIICLIESALSGIYMLQAEDRIVGISSNVYEESVFGEYAALDRRVAEKSLPTPGNWDFISIEQLVGLQPDLVIIWASQTEAIEAIESKGIPVYAIMITSTADIYKEIQDLGTITGKEERAGELISISRAFSAADTGMLQLPEEERPRLYFMWAQGPLETSGTGSTVNEVIQMAGARNACQIKDEHVVVNLENVIGWDPEVIVMWYNERIDPADILRMPEWQQISAVKNKRVYEFPSVFACDLWTLKFHHAVNLIRAWCYEPENADRISEQSRAALFEQLYGRGEDRN